MNKQVQWIVKPFGELTISELYEILHLRSKVFVVEQSDIYLDADNRDQEALHVLGVCEDQIAAYCRLFGSGDGKTEASIGRVIVAKEFRQFGIGQQLMTFGINILEKQFGETTIKISAQFYLLRFYESFGFSSVGKTYLDGTIVHVDMCRETKK